MPEQQHICCITTHATIHTVLGWHQLRHPCITHGSHVATTAHAILPKTHTHRQAAPKQYRTRTTADTLHTPRVRCRHKDVTWGRITQVQTNQQYVVFVGVALYNGMQVTRPHTQDYLWWYVQQGIMPLLVAHLSQAAFSASHCQERHTSCTKHASASAPEKAATTVDDTNHTLLLKPSP